MSYSTTFADDTLLENNFPTAMDDDSEGDDFDFDGDDDDSSEDDDMDFEGDDEVDFDEDDFGDDD